MPFLRMRAMSFPCRCVRFAARPSRRSMEWPDRPFCCWETMLRLIRRQFERDGAESESPRSSAVKLIVSDPGSPRRAAHRRRHFDNRARIQGAISRQEFGDAARFARESFRHIFPIKCRRRGAKLCPSISRRFRRYDKTERSSPLTGIFHKTTATRRELELSPIFIRSARISFQKPLLLASPCRHLKVLRTRVAPLPR